jgi:cAMP-dependent protein kinase regulator
LQTVPILSSVDSYERSKIADAIKEEHFKQGEVIINEGDQGNLFYIIIQGNAVATKA